MTTEHQGILIVEDDHDLRAAMAAYLEASGYHVVEAEDGAAALRLLRSSTSTFCLIILDLFMPVMNGLTFRQEQLRDPRLATIPVVIVSADASAPQRTIDLGAVDCMVKPVDFERLEAMVAHHC